MDAKFPSHELHKPVIEMIIIRSAVPWCVSLTFKKWKKKRSQDLKPFAKPQKPVLHIIEKSSSHFDS